MLEAKDWKHIFKLDPDKQISDEDLEAICESGSDAIMIGGTYGVTFDNTIELLARVRRYAIPCCLEISNQEAIVPGFDHYFVPIVLNARDSDWILQPHFQAVKDLGTMIPWHDISTVGYTVLNKEASVAELTKSETELSEEDIIAYGRLSYHLLKSSFFYLEYSGTIGDYEKLKVVSQRLKREGELHLFYGGGISSLEQAKQWLEVADTIVVGNIIYEDIEKAIQTVVK